MSDRQYISKLKNSIHSTIQDYNNELKYNIKIFKSIATSRSICFYLIVLYIVIHAYLIIDDFYDNTRRNGLSKLCDTLTFKPVQFCDYLFQNNKDCKSTKSYLLSFFCHIFVHLNLVHLIQNIAPLNCSGSIIEKFIGSKRFIIYYFLTGYLASFLSIFCFKIPYLQKHARSFTPSSGASGSIRAITSAYEYLLHFEDGKVAHCIKILKMEFSGEINDLQYYLIKKVCIKGLALFFVPLIKKWQDTTNDQDSKHIAQELINTFEESYDLKTYCSMRINMISVHLIGALLPLIYMQLFYSTIRI